MKYNSLSMIKYIAICLVIVCSLSLQTKVYQPENQKQAIVGEIGRLTFLPKQLFFVAQDQTHFGYLNKTNGRVTRISTLQNGQKIVDESKRTEIFLSKNKIILDYNITSKKGITDKRMKKTDVKEIKQYLRTVEGIFILTEKDLRVYDDKKKEDKDKYIMVVDKSSLKQGQSEEYIGIEAIIASEEEDKESITLVSIKKNQKQQRSLCLKKIVSLKVTKQQCYVVKEEGNPKIERSGNLIYIVFPQKTYVIRKNLQIKTTISEKPLQFYQGVAILQGHNSYNPQKDAIYEYRAVESTGDEMELIKMKIGKEEIIINKGQGELCKIQRSQKLNPLRTWMHKYKDQNKYDLVIQSENLELSKFTIQKQGDGDAKVSLDWTRSDSH